MKTEVCNFSKTSAAATGAVGVLTYELIHRGNKGSSEKVAVMFSVPYDHNMYKNWFAVGVYKDRECDEALYKEMYYDKEQKSFVREEAQGSGITFESNCLDVKANMSPMGRAIMKVEIWDKLFSRPSY